MFFNDFKFELTHDLQTGMDYIFLLGIFLFISLFGAILIRLFCRLFFAFTPKFWTAFFAHIFASVVIYVVKLASSLLFDLSNYKENTSFVFITVLINTLLAALIIG